MVENILKMKKGKLGLYLVKKLKTFKNYYYI